MKSIARIFDGTRRGSISLWMLESNGMAAQKKIRIALICGGKSAEHEVSLVSAGNIMAAIDARRYEVVLIGIDTQGRWKLLETEFLSHANLKKGTVVPHVGSAVAFVPGSGGVLVDTATGAEVAKIDVAFPILHGPFGEDGTVQGLLKLADVPFVGAGVLGSAVGMDKDVMKRLLRDAKIPVAKFLAFKHGETVSFAKAQKALGLPLFVKPANLGSSVGVSKVRTKREFDVAVAEAFRFDTKVIVEEFVRGREIECAVLGNDEPKASGVGEIIPHHEFYSYEAKYLDDDGAALEVPARIPSVVRKKAQEFAIKTFKALGCEGLGRVDFFLKKNGSLVVNEINTMPGFTKISMYPRLWAEAGVPYPELIHRLITLALERFAQERELETSRQ